eukprot:228322_1
MENDPNEILKFLRNNREVVSKTLERFFRRNKRPTIEQLITSGIMDKESVNMYYQLNANAVNNLIRIEMNYSDQILKILRQEEIEGAEMHLIPYQEDQLMKTLQDITFVAFNKCYQLTQVYENQTEISMGEMKKELKQMRSWLDAHVSNETQPSQQQKQLLTQRYKRLLNVKDRQEIIHEILSILCTVESKLLNIVNSWKRDYEKLFRFKIIINGDLNELNKQRGSMNDINEGIKELQMMQAMINESICNLKIAALQKLFDLHRIIGNAMGMGNAMEMQSEYNGKCEM